ncbi:MAG: hypothetical protein E7370_05540 [Clostridiales bacterium]|nr:hypothetical protein [Clostridiales bacterium]
MYFQIFACAGATVLFPLYGIITKKPFPPLLIWLICLHLFVSADIAAAMGGYYKYPWLDLLLHGYFGFLASVIIFCLLINWGGKNLQPFGFFIIIFAFAMGLAALWEVFEFIGDFLFNNTAQGVAPGFVWVEGEPSPLADTMEDIAVTALGVSAFYLFVFIDKLFGYKACKSLYNSFK